MSEPSPSVSVIIPVYNDPEGLRTTLLSLVDQSVNETNYEIVVVDNQSTDNTTNIIHEFVDNYPGIIKPTSEDQIQSSYAARNTGVSHSQGEILAFVDSDMWVDSDYIENIYNLMTEDEVDYVGLNVSLETDAHISTIAGKFDWYTGFPIREYINENNYAPTCCLVTRREVFHSVGGFDDRLVSGGDKVFGHHVHEQGYTQEFCEDISVYHPIRDSTSSMLKKAIRLGHGKRQLYQYYPHIDRNGSLRNPKTYLPPRPLRMKRIAESRKEIGILDFMQIYSFGWVHKYFRLYGILKE